MEISKWDFEYFSYNIFQGNWCEQFSSRLNLFLVHKLQKACSNCNKFNRRGDYHKSEACGNLKVSCVCMTCKGTFGCAPRSLKKRDGMGWAVVCMFLHSFQLIKHTLQIKELVLTKEQLVTHCLALKWSRGVP